MKRDPIAKATADLKALVDAMMEKAAPNTEAANAALERMIECVKRGDLEGAEAENDLFEAQWSARVDVMGSLPPNFLLSKRSAEVRSTATRDAAMKQRLPEFLKLARENHPKLNERQLKAQAIKDLAAKENMPVDQVRKILRK